MKVELQGEMSKNELVCKTLRELLKLKDVVVDTSILDDNSPNTMSNIASKTACISKDDNDDDSEEKEADKMALAMLRSSVWEMKQNVNQQYVAFCIPNDCTGLKGGRDY